MISSQYSPPWAEKTTVPISGERTIVSYYTSTTLGGDHIYEIIHWCMPTCICYTLSPNSSLQTHTRPEHAQVTGPRNFTTSHLQNDIVISQQVNVVISQQVIVVISQQVIVVISQQVIVVVLFVYSPFVQRQHR